MAVKKETKATAAKKTVKAVKEAAPKAKKTVAAVAAKAKTAGKASVKTTEVEFKVYAPGSASVAVAGDFNNWKPSALKKDKAGNWSGKLKLSTGAHQYKIVFNGQYWETDSSNPERVSDGHGGENSIKRV
ncbi:MAG: isoamylase early set domain-containing protein [Fibromonadales bacterium]|nr:isoamylase early set domain-containing protein [Fibromonadales bacterium]